MKALYEALNGWIGESYVRCYVWADNEAEARRLAVKSFNKYKPERIDALKINKLFDADSVAFATRPSDNGWEAWAPEPRALVMERWAPIVGAPGYDVSNLGRARSWRRPFNGRREKPYMLKPFAATDGRLRISARVEGKTHAKFIHRAILEAFVGPCPPGMEACHGNGDHQDNRLDNLRWDTRAANAKDRARHGTLYRGEQHHHSKLTNDDVRAIRKLHAEGRGQKEIGERFSVSQGTVSNIVKRQTWTHV